MPESEFDKDPNHASLKPGIDKVPIRVIKDSLSAILPSITSIINATFQSSTFPSCWKIAEVTPILKDGDHEIPNNNRPISLLPVLSKVCERAAHDQLVSYLSTKQRLTTQQCGNKKWNSTETALIQTTDFTLQNITQELFQEDTVSKMNEDLQRICQWTFTNKLLLNPGKTKLLVFGSRPLVHKVEGLHLSLLGKELTPAKSAKDLGVILDPT